MSLTLFEPPPQLFLQPLEMFGRFDEHVLSRQILTALSAVVQLAESLIFRTGRMKNVSIFNTK